MRKILLAVLLVVLVSAGCNQAANNNQPPILQPQTNQNQQPTAPNPPANQLSNNTDNPSGQAFENDYLKITVPNDWKLTEATKTVQNQSYDKNTGKTTNIGSPVTEKTGAVNIEKGNYILYINPQASQASGIEGGRFAEIASGAPSADAVVTEQPSPPCGTSQQTPAWSNYLREDLYISKQGAQDYCKVPTNGKTVWYFSYITSGGGYFNYYNTAGSGVGLVITMSYNSKNINTFPIQGSADLNNKLTEMTNILSTLQIIRTTPVVSYQDQVAAEFSSLADWTTSIQSDWGLSGFLDPKVVAKYPKTLVLRMSKTFNGNGCSSQAECDSQGIAKNNLVAAVKTALSQNGWVLTAQPTEGSAYEDTLYVKNGKPLILSIGSRDAVTGGEYVEIQIGY